MSSQAQDLHRALLRPFILHTLRAAGFHGTRPSVLDTLTDLAERHLLLLGETTAHLAMQAHNDPIPSISDARVALSECGVLGGENGVPGAGEEGWREILRAPLEVLANEVDLKAGKPGAGTERATREKRKRDDGDLADVRRLTAWVDGRAYAEIKRVAGLVPDATTAGAPAVGVGGGMVHAEDFLTGLKKKLGKAGMVDEGRLVGTVLGGPGEDRELMVEGGPVGRISDWIPGEQQQVDAKWVQSEFEEQESVGVQPNGEMVVDAVS